MHLFKASRIFPKVYYSCQIIANRHCFQGCSGSNCNPATPLHWLGILLLPSTGLVFCYCPPGLVFCYCPPLAWYFAAPLHWLGILLLPSTGLVFCYCPPGLVFCYSPPLAWYFATVLLAWYFAAPLHWLGILLLPSSGLVLCYCPPLAWHFATALLWLGTLLLPSSGLAFCYSPPLACYCPPFCLLPLDGVLCFFLYKPNPLQDVGDVIDTPLLLHIQHVRCLQAMQQESCLGQAKWSLYRGDLIMRIPFNCFNSF